VTQAEVDKALQLNRGMKSISLRDRAFSTTINGVWGRSMTWVMGTFYDLAEEADRYLLDFFPTLNN
jgi:hypothetical protein